MKILLDTHIFLWAISNPALLSNKRVQMLQNLTNTIFVSSMSAAEISLKASIGKLEFDYNIEEIIEKSGFEELKYGIKEAKALKTLPFHHKDPFDRMLITQAQANDIYLMSDDRKFEMYDVKLV